MGLLFSRRRSLTGGLFPAVSWGGLPLLLMVIFKGLPIGRELTPATKRIAGALHEATLESVSTAGYEKTLAVVFVFGSLYLLGAMAAWRARSLTLPLVKGQWPLTALTLLAGVSALWAYSPAKAIMNFGHSTGVLLVAVAAALRYRNEPLLFVRHLGYALGLNILLQVLAVIALPSIAIEYDGRWRGLTTNSNTLGAISFCAIWANGLAWLYFRERKRMLSLIISALAVVALLGSQSKTSLLCAMLVIGVAGGLYYFRRRPPIKAMHLVIVFVCCLTGIFLALEIFGFNLSPSEIAPYLGRSKEFSGRTEAWRLALQLFSNNVWIGYGFDDNAGVISTTSFRHISFHNGFLDLAVRGGALAILLFFVMLIKILRSLGRFVVGREYVFQLFLPFVLALILYNLMETTLMAPKNLIWLIFITTAFLVAAHRLHLKRIY